MQEMDSGAEHLYSSRFACPHCQYALGELEPRLFSFNCPRGPAQPATAWASKTCSTRRACWRFPA